MDHFYKPTFTAPGWAFMTWGSAAGQSLIEEAMTKYDGACLHGAGSGTPGDCVLPRREGSCLCEEHHERVLAGVEKAPPLRMTYDYVAIMRPLIFP
jgi:hypothetical protein